LFFRGICHVISDRNQAETRLIVRKM
jgi:hypothetical protein